MRSKHVQYSTRYECMQAPAEMPVSAMDSYARYITCSIDLFSGRGARTFAYRPYSMIEEYRDQAIQRTIHVNTDGSLVYSK